MRKKSIVLSDQKKIKLFKPEVDELLRFLKHQEALVTDESTVADFISLTEDSSKVCRELEEFLYSRIRKNHSVHPGSKICAIAERIAACARESKITAITEIPTCDKKKSNPVAQSTTGRGVPGEKVNHPMHYNLHPSGVECIDVVEHMSFNLGNAVKYIWRADLKESVEQDLKKAIFYINREMALRNKLSSKESTNG